MSQLDLLMHLCSRLCHDLAGPISAIGNGVELLAEEGDPAMQKQALELVGESTRAAAQRLKFFRLAFGAGGAFGSEIKASEAADAAQGLFSDSRAKLDWKPDGNAVIAKNDAKILLCLLMLAAGALPRGGTVAVMTGAQESKISAGGGKVRLDAPGLAALAAGSTPEKVDTENAVAALAMALAREFGRRIGVSLDSEQLAMTITGTN